MYKVSVESSSGDSTETFQTASEARTFLQKQVDRGKWVFDPKGTFLPNIPEGDISEGQYTVTDQLAGGK